MDLVISKMEEADFEVFHRWFRDPAYAPFFRHVPDNMTPEQLKFIFTTVGVLIRVDSGADKMASVVSIAASPKTSIAEVGVIVRKDLQKTGLGRAVTKKVVNHIFTEGTINRIIMMVTEPDLIAALKRGGMFEECRIYKNAYYNGKLHNESRMVVTKDFYNKLGAKPC